VTRARLLPWLIWPSLFVAVTFAFNRFAGLPELRVAHGVLTFLVLIIGASRHGGRTISLVMVTLGYFAVDYYFIPPRFSFGPASSFDLIVLLAFVATGLLVSELFAAQQRAVRLAEERAREVERLSHERLQLEREAANARVLREADRLKNALLSSIAHDLRSPVSTLSLLSDPAAGFSTDTALHRVSEEAQRLGEFIGTLQRFALEGGGSMLHSDDHPVETLVQTALRTAEGVLAGRSVQVSLPPQQTLVHCDLTLAVQVLGNLLQNAARYSPAEATIEITGCVEESSVAIMVADRGAGVQATEVERLFSPLRRRTVDPSTTSEDAGVAVRMGMGLSIARTFARAQRGDVRYHPREGGGSEFTLQLPRNAPALASFSAPTSHSR
jgi:K+-sensing histidine kinase KdpD